MIDKGRLDKPKVYSDPQKFKSKKEITRDFDLNWRILVRITFILDLLGHYIMLKCKVPENISITDADDTSRFSSLIPGRLNKIYSRKCRDWGLGAASYTLYPLPS